LSECRKKRLLEIDALLNSLEEVFFKLTGAIDAVEPKKKLPKQKKIPKKKKEPKAKKEVVKKEKPLKQSIEKKPREKKPPKSKAETQSNGSMEIESGMEYYSLFIYSLFCRTRSLTIRKCRRNEDTEKETC
jgi:hypothetical protein